MGFLDIFNTSAPTERIQYAMQNQSLQDELGHVKGELQDVQENLLRISDAFDNAGWAPLDEQQTAEIPLATVKKVATIARALNAVNPFVKRGVEARIGYIWGKGVMFDGVDAIDELMHENRKKLFTPQAFEELERALATDGNAFTAVPNDNNTDETATAFRISLDQITDAVSNPLDKEEIWYYRREYTITKTNSVTGVVSSDTVIKYYVSMEHWLRLQKQNKNLPRRWKTFGVEQNYVMQHVSVNKQVGWRWGVPDVMSVIFWAKAYKEYLEDNATLVKAYSRLAWEVKAPSAVGGQAAAAQVMAPPTRDPLTGEQRNIGGTAITGMGGGMSSVPATGSQVDFSKGAPLASAIAAGLEVPLIVITSDSGSSNRSAADSLDLPTLKAMEKRQQLHSERFLELFEFWGADVRAPLSGSSERTRDISEAKSDTEGTGATHAMVTWPQISSDATKDRITALGLATELGVIYKQEARKEALDVFGIAPYKPWDDLPTMEDDPAAKEAMLQAEVAADKAAAAAADASSVVPGQGKSGGLAARGGATTNNNEARDSRAENEGK